MGPVSRPHGEEGGLPLGHLGVLAMRQSVRVAMVLGEVSSEGGPFLIIDRLDAEAWRGSLDDGHYDHVISVPHMTGPLEFDGRPAVVWEAEGAGTARVYRHAADRLLLQREWADGADTPDVSPAAEEFASLKIASGGVVVMWAPVAWDDLWDPPARGSVAQLSMPSALNVGLQLALESGRYTFAYERTDEAIRCWITRRS